MSSPEELAALVGALQPVVSRISKTTCWVKRNGKLTHIKEPLTAAKLTKHVNGSGLAYGACPIAPGQSVTMAAVFDLDSHKGETPWSDMQALALRILAAAGEIGLEAIPFRSSGGAGMHIYFLWGAPQDAYSVRQALAGILAACEFKPGTAGVNEGEIEIFPKQDHVPADGFGSMFVLPLAAASVPLDTFELGDTPKEYAITMDWPISMPVPVLEKPLIAISTADLTVDLGELQKALGAIDNAGNGLDYDNWRNVIFALHHETQGSTDGLALAHVFSARSAKYDPEFLENRVWPFVKSERDTAITGGTIFKMAREAGWTEDVTAHFDVIEPAKNTPDAFPKFTRKKNGEILSTIDNITMAVRSRDYTGHAIAFDEFRDEIMLTPKGLTEWRAFTDPDYTRMRIGLEKRGFGPVGREMIRDAVALVAEENRFDSAIEWLKSLPPSTEDRCATFLTRYCGVEDTPYHRAVSLYLWTALAGRVLTPGVQADMAVILVGTQGLHKSTLAKAIAPQIDHFTEISLDERDADLSRKMRGTLVAEIGELRGLHSRELEAIKSFITRTHEEWTPKFKEFGTKFARRLVFVGTTNQDEILSDETGNRRFLPVTVERKIDTDAVRSDLLLLWAEGRELYRKNGVMWQAAERLAPEQHAQYMVNDAWSDDIAEWLDGYEMDATAPRWHSEFSTKDVLRGALSIAASISNKSHEMRIGKALRGLGFVRDQKRRDGKPTRMWQYDLI